MAKIKISQLPAKAANLAATDLLEVSEVSGLTYVSKKITGAELVGNRVPYTGATSDVDLGEYELKAGQIELDQSPTGTAGVAVTRWNDSLGSTETTLKGGSVILKNGVDLVARVVNKVTPNTTLTKAAYSVVKISGAQGQRLAVDYAQANNDNNSADTLGVVTETIATNQEGFIMTVGQLEGVNTSGSLQGETWLDGDVLYLSPTVPGAVTKVKPTGATGHIVVIGYVEHAHNVNGKIYVKIMNGWELDELHNVYINSGTLANNDALIYESSTQLWKNKTIATALGYTPENVSNKSTNTSLGTSDTLYPTQNAVKTYTDNILGNANALVYKGVIDCSANPNYPAADAGWMYIVSVAGKIGGASGIDVEVGDMLICNTDGTVSGNQATVGSYWNAIQKNIVGAVTGPASSTNNNVAFFDGTTGKIIKDSGITLSGTNTGDQTLSGLGGVPTSRNLTINGTTSDLSADRTFTVTDANLSTSDITTNNVSITKHGFAPKLPNDASKFLDGTGNYTSPPTGLTVGTTAVTSGTDGRVFFQAGGVVQQDANFTFDNTLKRLTLKAVGTASTDIPFAVQNSAGTANLIDIKGDNNTTFYQYNAGLTNNSLNILNVNADTAARFDLGGVSTFNFVSLIQTKATAAGQGVPATANFRGFLYASNANGNHFVISANDGIAFSGQNPNGYASTSDQMRLKNGNLAIGTGYSASARLDVKAQGALSTDIAFRVRNSADSANIVSFTGNGDISLGVSATGITASNNPFIAIGQSAKGSQYGVSIGNYAGLNADNGDRRNIYIGNDVASVGSNRTASKNIGIGNSSLRSINSGTCNVAIGAGAAAGEAAGYDLTTGSNNVMIGFSAGAQITIASSNTSLGAYAGSNNVTGAANTQIGYAVYQGVGTNKTLNTGIGIRMKSSHDGAIMIGSSSDSSTDANSIADDAAQFHFRSTNQSFFFNKNTNVVLKSNSALVSGTDFEAAATNTITIHNGTAPTTNIATAGQLYAESGALRYRDSAGTITNVGGSVQAVVSAATVTPVYTNKFVKITAQAAALTLANPTGTWAEGQDLMIRIKDDGLGARAITWDTNYRAIGVTLPTITVLGKTTYVGVIYNSDDAKWDVIGVTTQA